jgi:cytochrome c55X
VDVQADAVSLRAAIGITLLALLACIALLHASAAGAQTSASAAADGSSSAVEGKSLYTGFCARCHGVNMVASGAGFDLRSFPKDQRARFERSVTEGLRAMPAWGNRFTAQELESLWLFVSAGS